MFRLCVAARSGGHLPLGLLSDGAGDGPLKISTSIFSVFSTLEKSVEAGPRASQGAPEVAFRPHRVKDYIENISN